MYIHLFIYIPIYILPFQTENGKRKPRRFSLILLPFAHRANGSYPFANGLNGLEGLGHLCRIVTDSN